MRERGRTTRIFIVLFAIAAMATFCIWQATAGQGTTSFQKGKLARITLTDNVYDFGEIIQGEKPVATFVFRNTGDDVLLIDQVVTDNKNVTTEVSHELLLPGEQGTIQAILDSTKLYGRVLSRITVITNDEERPKVFLQVRAHVRAILALRPPFVFVGQIPREGSFSGKAKVVGKLVDEGKLKAIQIRKSSEAIEARIMQRRPKDAILEFVLRPEQKAGTFEESITLISKDPPAQAQLLLYGQKLGIIRVTPDRLEFFPEKGVKPDSRSVMFECDKPFKITKIEDHSGFLNFTINTLEEGRKYELIARLKSPMEGTFLGVVKIYTDLEVHPLIHIPVIGGGS